MLRRMRCKYRVYIDTDVGRVRDHNEDYYVTLKSGDDLLVVAVADGVGGLAAGEVASSIGSTSFVAEVARRLINYVGKGIIDDVDFSNIMRDAVNVANKAIKGGVAGSGTTLTSAVLFSNCTGYIVNVGDSRAYLIDDREAAQITRDHSRAWASYENELIKLLTSVKEAVRIDYANDFLKRLARWKVEYLNKHPQAHVIWNVVGYFNEVYSDIFRVSLNPGDTLLLTTDGLTDVVDDYEIWNIVRRNKPQDAVKALIKTANKRGGPDNITIALITVEEANTP